MGKLITNVSVGTRLGISVILPMLALVATVISAVLIFHNINDSVDSLYLDRVKPLGQLKEISDDYAVLIIDAVNKANAGLITAEETLSALREAKTRASEHWQEYISTYLTAEEQTLGKRFEKQTAIAWEVINQLEDRLLSVSGDISGRLHEFDGPLYKVIDPLGATLGELIHIQLDEAGKLNEYVHRETATSTRFYLAGTVILALIMMIVSYGIVRSITQPLKQFNQVMNRIESNSDLSLTIDLHSKDEFGQTAGAFNRMMTRINSTMVQVKQAVEELSYASGHLSGIATDTNQRLQRQQSETDQVAVATHEMTTTVSELTVNTSDAQVAAENADQMAVEGRRLADRNMSLTMALSEEILQTSDEIQNLENQCQSIGTVIDVISGIAEQTNLLALNAAIEAARAGEQGRGFAVVADEVRTLAQRTQESTEEISQLVDKLQHGSKSSVTAMESGLKKADECNDAIKQGQGSLVKIEQAVQNIRDMNIQIATALEEQSAVTAEINKNINNISTISSESASAGNEILKSSQKLSDMSATLKGQVDCFKIKEG